MGEGDNVEMTLDGVRVLVTGASGRIGSVASARLSAAGALVTALSDRDNPDLVADRVFLGDVRNEEDVARAIEGAELVVHLAALAHRDAASPFQVYSTNVVATFNVLAQAGALGVKRAVVAGSINRFGVPMNLHPGLLPAYFPIDDDIPTDIGDWYSLSKLNDENTARMAARVWGIDVVTLRFPHVNEEKALQRMATRAAEDPTERASEGWSYLDVRDAARAIELSLVAHTEGAVAFFLAADNTLAPYRTDELIDRYAPTTPRLRRFVEREVPIDLAPARELIGFRAVHELNIETRDLPELLQSHDDETALRDESASMTPPHQRINP